MSLEILRNWLLVCGLINMAMLMLWAMMFIFARDWIYKVHTKWFKLSDEKFDSIHYSGMALYKLVIFFFNLVPYFALLIIDGRL
jgi:hypothetical protein